MTPAAGSKTSQRDAVVQRPGRSRRPRRARALTAALGALIALTPLACTPTAAPGEAAPAAASPAAAASPGVAPVDPGTATPSAADAATGAGVGTARAAEPVATALRDPAVVGGWLLAGLDDVAEPNPDLASALHQVANEARADHGAPAAAWDEGLARAARQHAAELAARNVLDHQGLEAERRTVADRLARSGSPYATHAENLAAVPPDFDVPRATVEGWLGSPGHRENLLWPGFDRAGYGTAIGAGGTVFVVQVLAQAPWAPLTWTTTLVELELVRLTLELAVAESATVLIDIEGVRTQHRLDAGNVSWVADVAPPGPWEVVIGAPGATPGRFTIDDAGTVGLDGRWRPDDRGVRPREVAQVRGASVEPYVREVVRLQLVLPTEAAELVAGAQQVAGANRGGGLIEADLDLGDGAELLVGLAEPREDGALAVRHRWVLRREGSVVQWVARP